MAPTVTPLSPIGNTAESAGTTVESPASPPLLPRRGCCSGLPAAALPPPLKSADRSIIVASTCMVVFLNVDIAAGLFATTEVSPPAVAEPAKARPMALTLFSLSWKPDAWAWPNASAPQIASASAETRVMLWTCGIALCLR